MPGVATPAAPGVCPPCGGAGAFVNGGTGGGGKSFGLFTGCAGMMPGRRTGNTGRGALGCAVCTPGNAVNAGARGGCAATPLRSCAAAFSSSSFCANGYGGVNGAGVGEDAEAVREAGGATVGITEIEAYT